MRWRNVLKFGTMFILLGVTTFVLVRMWVHTSVEGSLTPLVIAAKQYTSWYHQAPSSTDVIATKLKPEFRNISEIWKRYHVRSTCIQSGERLTINIYVPYPLWPIQITSRTQVSKDAYFSGALIEQPGKMSNSPK